MNRSDRLTEAACTRMSSSPPAGAGTATLSSWRTSSPPKRWIWMACIVALTVFATGDSGWRSRVDHHTRFGLGVQSAAQRPGAREPVHVFRQEDLAAADHERTRSIDRR